MTVEAMYDATDDDAFAEGDPTLETVDAVSLAELARRYDAAMKLPEGDARNLEMAAVLSEMWGDKLGVW